MGCIPLLRSNNSVVAIRGRRNPWRKTLHSAPALRPQGRQVAAVCLYRNVTFFLPSDASLQDALVIQTLFLMVL